MLLMTMFTTKMMFSMQMLINTRTSLIFLRRFLDHWCRYVTEECWQIFLCIINDIVVVGKSWQQQDSWPGQAPSSSVVQQSHLAPHYCHYPLQHPHHHWSPWKSPSPHDAPQVKLIVIWSMKYTWLFIDSCSWIFHLYCKWLKSSCYLDHLLLLELFPRHVVTIIFIFQELGSV